MAEEQGGAYGPEMEAQSPIEAAEQKDAFLDEITKDFERLQKQKARPMGGTEARILTNIAMVWGEQTVVQRGLGIVTEQIEENKLNLVFNLIEGIVGKLIGRLSSIAPVFQARPDKADPAALAEAEVVDKLLIALDDKLDQPSKTWELLWWMAVAGVAFEYTPWIPNATIEPEPQFDANGEVLFTDTHSGQVVPKAMVDQAVQMGIPFERFEVYEEVVSTGDVGSEIVSPLNVFVDQSVKSIPEMAPDQCVYIAKIRTQGWIEENFPEIAKDKDFDYDKELNIVTTAVLNEGQAVASLFLQDMIPTVRGRCEDDDPQMAVVVERYMPASQARPKGRYTIFVPKKRILADGDNPYREIPVVDYHWRPVTTNFWTKDFVTDLIAPQRFLNKRLSQLGEQANASIYAQLLMGGTLTANDYTADRPGVITGAFADNGQPLVKRLEGPQLPGWFMDSIKLVGELMKAIAGGADLFSEDKFPGQLRGPMAVPMLQEILDTEWGPLYQHIGQRMARTKQMRLNIVKEFYPPQRTLHYVDKDLKHEVLEFHKEKVLGSGTNFNITVERGSLLPELRALNEARIIERLNSPLGILYVDERTGRPDKSKIAADIKMGDSARVDKETQARKFAQQIIDMLRNGKQVPPVLPFYKHGPMMDELEAVMTTTEFMGMSVQIQQLFMDRYNQHGQFLQQQAEAQAAAESGQAIQRAVAQATQMAAAKAAAETVTSVRGQLQAQKSLQGGQVVENATGEAVAAVATKPQGGRPPNGPARPNAPERPGEAPEGRGPQR